MPSWKLRFLLVCVFRILLLNGNRASSGWLQQRRICYRVSMLPTDGWTQWPVGLLPDRRSHHWYVVQDCCHTSVGRCRSSPSVPGWPPCFCPSAGVRVPCSARLRAQRHGSPAGVRDRSSSAVGSHTPAHTHSQMRACHRPGSSGELTFGHLTPLRGK